MSSYSQLFAQHLDTLQQRTRDILQQQGLGGLAIHSGQTHRIFLDDQDYPFKVNPQFKAWLPVLDNPHCWLLVDGVNKPVLLFYRPVDFWHKVAELPNAFWIDFFDIRFLTRPEQVADHLPANKQEWAYLGGHLEVAELLGLGQPNPEAVLNYLHYHRAYKTPYELECLRDANRIGVRGHIAAKDSFMAGASEFEINLAYMKAVGQGPMRRPTATLLPSTAMRPSCTTPISPPSGCRMRSVTPFSSMPVWTCTVMPPTLPGPGPGAAVSSPI